jgi:hypothetical protein
MADTVWREGENIESANDMFQITRNRKFTKKEKDFDDSHVEKSAPPPGLHIEKFVGSLEEVESRDIEKY